MQAHLSVGPTVGSETAASVLHRVDQCVSPLKIRQRGTARSRPNPPPPTPAARTCTGGRTLFRAPFLILERCSSGNVRTLPEGMVFKDVHDRRCLGGVGDKERGEEKHGVREQASACARVIAMHLPQSCQKTVLHVFRWKTADRINSLSLCMGDNKDGGGGWRGEGCRWGKGREREKRHISLALTCKARLNTIVAGRKPLTPSLFHVSPVLHFVVEKKKSSPSFPGSGLGNDRNPARNLNMWCSSDSKTAAVRTEREKKPCRNNIKKKAELYEEVNQRRTLKK